MTAPARIGWLGGTFDPIHNGHLDVARAAHHALSLDEVFLVPARIPPHRPAPLASAAHRLAMVEQAAGSEPWLRVSDIELNSDGPSYTSHTLDRLAERGVGLDAVHVITGADAFAKILTWKDAPQLLDRCHFVAVSRPGHPASSLRQVLPALVSRMIDVNGKTGANECAAPTQPSIFLVDAPTAAVSSTAVRAQAAIGQTPDTMVPPAVAAYIEQHGLYRQGLGVA